MNTPFRKIVNTTGNRNVFPVDQLPETVWVGYRSHKGHQVDIELPTKEVYQQGQYGSFTSTGISINKVFKALSERLIYPKGIILDPRIHGIELR